MYFKYPIIDTHIHVGDIEEINKAVKKAEYEQYVLLSGSINPKCVWGNLELLDIKKKAPEKIYAYACLHKTGEGAPEADELLRQVQAYHKVGFDGMKLLFGKPECRKADGVSLCDECYDPMYDFLERNNIPVLLHSNDPVEFWDKERIPKWAMEAGYYCDETYPTHEQIREETIGILKKHPKLNMTIAHIFFLSNADQYDLAEELLETYPNLTFDLCPGWEMYEGFERDERWRDFIEKYAGRLVYGTDIFGAGWEERIECLRSSLETDAVYMNADGYRCKGLNLSDEALKKIYRDTYRSVIQPGNPKPIDDKAVKEEYLPIALEWTKRMYPDAAEQEKVKEKLLALVEK